MKGKGILTIAVLLAATLLLAFTANFGYTKNRVLSINNIKQGFDLKGGVYVLYEAAENNPTELQMLSAVSMLKDRLERRSFVDAQVVKDGAKRIKVEIPGIQNIDEIVNEIGKTAKLLFVGPDGIVIATGEQVQSATTVQAEAEDGSLETCVMLKFNPLGTELFAAATEKHINDHIYIVMDETTISAPLVKIPITSGECRIFGDFSDENAEELAALIRAGALPFNLNIIEMKDIGTRIGGDSLQKSVFAGMIGASLILLLMIVMYGISGFATDWSLIIYIYIFLIILSLSGLILTLPSIAGIVFSIAMAAGINVIVFERVKQCVNEDTKLKDSLNTGYSKAFLAVIDSSVVVLIAAVVLYSLGEGGIKEFSLTIIIGLFISLFTSMVITKEIIGALINLGLDNPRLYGFKSK